MLDVPELDGLICRCLDQHDLAQCARVNKKWHSIVLPHLWRDLSSISFFRDHQSKAIRRVVLEDYLRFQQQQQSNSSQDHDDRLNLSVQAPSPPPLQSSPSTVSTLVKYGSWIRELPYPNDLLACLKPPGDSQEPTEHDLLRHLYKVCPNIPVDFLHITGKQLASDNYLKTMALILPNVRHLSIEAAKSDTESWRLKYVLGHCSSALEVLTLGVNVIYTSEVKKREEATKESDEPKYWTSLRSLTLWYAGDGSCVHTFWSWLLKRCYHVERLEVMEIRDIIPALLVGIWKHMPYISEISLGRNSIETQDLTDDQVMSLLSVRHQGWKVIEIGYTARFGSKARQALAKHFPTLQVLAVDGSRDFTSKDLIWVLSSCPRLRILNVIDEDQYVRDTFIRFGAREFIDMDPFTGALNPWACESSLKELRVRITGIPRPDLQDNIAIEAYPDEGRVIQGQVYDRLARLTNLETLTLNHSAMFNDQPEDVEPIDQDDCLEMSLESGLYRLAGLKQMKELDVSYMKTRIGLNEGQWMAEHWPQLRNLISWGAANIEVVNWLNENCPQIHAYCDMVPSTLRA